KAGQRPGEAGCRILPSGEQDERPFRAYVDEVLLDHPTRDSVSGGLYQHTPLSGGSSSPASSPSRKRPRGSSSGSARPAATRSRPPARPARGGPAPFLARDRYFAPIDPRLASSLAGPARPAL